MHKLTCVLLLLGFMLFAGCSSSLTDLIHRTGNKAASSGVNTSNVDMSMELFSATGSDIAAPDGTEYALFGHEGPLDLVGRKKLIGRMRDEQAQDGNGRELGLFACEQDKDRVMLLRYTSDSEWGVFYRKKSASALDISMSNCHRLLFVESRDEALAAKPFYDNIGFVGKERVSKFLSAVTAEKAAQVKALYQSVEQKDGTLKNCYEAGVVYGFFANENVVAVVFPVTSFDDKAYSIMIDNVEYVLPKEYLQELTSSND